MSKTYQTKAEKYIDMAIAAFEKLRSEYFTQILNNEDIDIDQIKIIESGTHEEPMSYILLNVTVHFIVDTFKKMFPEINNIVPDPDYKQQCIDWYFQTPKILYKLFRCAISSTDIDIAYPILYIVSNMNKVTVVNVFSSMITYDDMWNQFTGQDKCRIVHYIYPELQSFETKAILNMYSTYGDLIDHDVYWYHFLGCNPHIDSSFSKDENIIAMEQANYLYDKLHSIEPSYKIPHSLISVYKTSVAIENQFYKIIQNAKQAQPYLKLDAIHQLEMIKNSDILAAEYSVLYIFWSNFIKHLPTCSIISCQNVIYYISQHFVDRMFASVDTHKKYIDYIYSQMSEKHHYDYVYEQSVREVVYNLRNALS
jgi:hypothetical protein